MFSMSVCVVYERSSKLLKVFNYEDWFGIQGRERERKRERERERESRAEKNPLENDKIDRYERIC